MKPAPSNFCPTPVIKESIDFVKNPDGVKFLPYLLELKPLHGKDNDTNCNMIRFGTNAVTRITTRTRKRKKLSLVKCSALNGLEVGEDRQVRHVGRP